MMTDITIFSKLHLPFYQQKQSFTAVPQNRCFPVKFAKFSRTLFLQNTSGAASTLVKAEIPICSSLFISLHYCISPLIKVCAKPRKDSAVSHHLLNCQVCN